jgi:uncharacterized repeat protein (TIGR02543 family)
MHNVTVSSGGVNATGGAAIGVNSASTKVKIDGGDVRATTGFAVAVNGAGGSVTVNGGRVSATTGAAIGVNNTDAVIAVYNGDVRATTGFAIAVNGAGASVTVDGGTVSATNQAAIAVAGAGSEVKVHSGFVFAYGTGITGEGNVVNMTNGATPTIDGSAVLCAWDKGAAMAYDEGANDDLTVNAGAAATWGISSGQNGISYANGSNTGFFQIDDIIFTVSFDSTGGSAVASQSVPSGGKASKLADPTREGYAFGGWYADSGLTAAYSFDSPVTAGITLYAKWTASAAQSTGNLITLKIDDPYMYVNGVKQEIDPGRGTAPMIVGGRTIMPIRAVVEAMGGNIAYEDSTRAITLAAKGHSIIMWLDQQNFVVDGQSLSMDVAPASINSRTMVPLRFASENLGCDVKWIDATRSVEIRY